MFESGQNWELFGYDMRNLGRHWTDAWRDLLFADDSPVRRHLDDVVCLRTPGGETFHQAGKPSDVAVAQFSAYLLPEELVLSKTLTLPQAVEGDLASALALEVNAYSPFSAADTSYGWRVVRRSAARIQLLLAIVSKSSAMAYLGRHFDIHDPRQAEVWVKVGADMVALQGYGQKPREAHYRRRLVRVAAMVAASALLLLSVVGASAGLKAVELQRVQVLAAATERESAEASRHRAALALANEKIASVNRIAATFPNPHIEISRLTHLLQEGESVEHFSMNGLEINLRGRATDAASVMQRLTDQAEYAEVSAPRAFARDKDSQAEQFYLTIQMREQASP